MSIERLQGLNVTLDGTREVEPSAKEQGFGQALLDAVQRVAESQEDAKAAADQFTADPGAKIHETMLRMQKADISLRAFVTMRNKMLDAYREIMRMGQ